MIPSIFTTLALVASSLSFAGQILYSQIVALTTFVPGSVIQSGNTFLLTDTNSTTTPSVFLKTETPAIKTWPTDPGVEHCEGNTGALLCNITVKLTGSGGNKNHNAGSFVCSTSTCSIVSARVLTEAIPKANERLYGGWTTTPGTASGAQVFNNFAASSGATIIGSGAYTLGGSNPVNVEKDVPPGSTFKFTWSLGDGTEDYSTYKAAAVLQYYKYYNP